MKGRSEIAPWFALLLSLSLVPSSASIPENSTNPVQNARIEVQKGARVLRLFSGDELLREYRIGLGFDSISDKTRQGDGATPEGDYIVCVKNPESRFYLSLGISYPNVEDAMRGLASGLIGRNEFGAIKSAHDRGRRPPWDTALGGEIYIHGNGSSSDWTLGCVALDDHHMKELYDAVVVGTPVKILP